MALIKARQASTKLPKILKGIERIQKMGSSRSTRIARGPVRTKRRHQRINPIKKFMSIEWN
jgi:hypothetical protein